MYRESKELGATTKVGQWRELTEAIRAGCKLRPIQGFGADAACVLSTANSVWPQYTLMPVPTHTTVGGCPACRFEYGNTAAHLNDDHRWTREAIADWLDTF